MVLVESEETATVLETPDLHRKFLNVRYAECTDDEVMDIYLPEQGEGPFPVIVDIHGGGWYYGAKSSLKIKPVLQGLKRGYAVVSLQYTWSVHGHFPIQIYDIKAAIRYLRANAAAYHINPDKIGLWGLSAGAHLASLAGTGAAVPQLEDLDMGNPRESSAVQCVVALYPIIDITKLERQHRQYGMNPNEACTNDESMGGCSSEWPPVRFLIYVNWQIRKITLQKTALLFLSSMDWLIRLFHFSRVYYLQISWRK